MKFLIYSWTCDPTTIDYLDKRGFEHNSFEEVESNEEFYELVDSIVDDEFDVMLTNKGDYMSLFIDTNKFRQR